MQATFAAVLAFRCMAISGIRAPAYVVIFITGAVVMSATHLLTIFHVAGSLVSNHLTAPQWRFSMSPLPSRRSVLHAAFDT